MLKQISIKNFKSIANDTIDLGRINVFIGENGCGKSNILEAVAFWSAGLENGGKINNEDLISKGVRIAKPSLMLSSFKEKKKPSKIEIEVVADNTSEKYSIDYKPTDLDSIFSEWKSIEKMSFSAEFEKLLQDLFNEATISVPEAAQKEKFVELLDKVIQSPMYELPYNSDFVIYGLNTPALRGYTKESHKEPVGIYGENLDVLLADFSKEELAKLNEYTYLIGWLDRFVLDMEDRNKLRGLKMNRSDSRLYFSDKYMQKSNNIFSSENANEGILHVLFYLAVLISKRTPRFFAIDNIESALNPHLCRHLMTQVCKLAKENDKQLLITTHNPAILDGLNLFDDEVRLFEVRRTDSGHTATRRIKLKPDTNGESLKLSELWTRGFLGAISNDF